MFRTAADACRRLRRCTRGATAIEFAIIALAMILVSVAVIEFGRGLHERNRLSFLADLGARIILINPSTSIAEVETKLRSMFAGSEPELLQITLGVETVGGLVFRTIAISRPLRLLVPGLARDQITVGVARRVPVKCSSLALDLCPVVLPPIL